MRSLGELALEELVRGELARRGLALGELALGELALGELALGEHVRGGDCIEPPILTLTWPALFAAAKYRATGPGVLSWEGTLNRGSS